VPVAIFAVMLIAEVIVTCIRSCKPEERRDNCAGIR